jgi:hypothetical protein
LAFANNACLNHILLDASLILLPSCFGLKELNEQLEKFGPKIGSRAIQQIGCAGYKRQAASPYWPIVSSVCKGQYAKSGAFKIMQSIQQRCVWAEFVFQCDQKNIGA